MNKRISGSLAIIFLAVIGFIIVLSIVLIIRATDPPASPSDTSDTSDAEATQGLIMQSYDKILTSYRGDASEVVIPNTVTIISNEAFKDCTWVTSITIPNSVTQISSNAFQGCTALESISIPDSVTYIGDHAFQGCTSLKNIHISDSVTTISSLAFEGCPALLYNTYDNAYYLGNEDNPYQILVKPTNYSIRSLTIHPDTRVICGNAFADTVVDPNDPEKPYTIACNLLTEIVIPESVISISFGAFEGCTGLEKITITFVGSHLNENYAPFLNGYTNYYDHFGFIFGARYPSEQRAYIPPSLKEVVITGGDRINTNAFRDCTPLRDVTITKGVTSIERDAFNSCENLTSIVISSGLTTIGEYAFSGCYGLSSVTIPDSVTSIGDYAFHSSVNNCAFYYQGTMENWHKITDNADGIKIMPSTATIHCSDGDIKPD